MGNEMIAVTVADTAYPLVLVDRSVDGLVQVVISASLPPSVARDALTQLLTKPERDELAAA